MSAIPADLRISHPWRAALITSLVMLAALLLLYRGTFTEMVGIWDRSDTFAHCFLVPPISAWLIWRQRAELAAVAPRAQPVFLLALLPLAVLWLLGDLVAVNALTQFAVVAMITVIVPAAWGWPAARRVMFPVLFLFFSVPIGEFLTPMFMERTADFTVLAVRASGVPVYREGLRFNIPSGSWSVVEACSGVRYLIASFMVGTLFAYLNYRSTTRRIVFMGVSILVPIVANWVRAYMIVMLGHLSGNTIAVGADHLVYGWVFFGVVVLIMFFIGARWAEPDAVAPPAAAPVSAATAAAGDRAGWLTAGLAVVALLLPHAVLMAVTRAEGAAIPVALTLPETLAATTPWQSVPGNAARPAWKPRFVNPSLELQRTYEANGQRVGVHVAYYRDQGYQRKLVTSENLLVHSEDPDWARAGSGQVSATVNGHALALRSAHLRSGDLQGAERRGQIVVLQAYWVDGQWLASDVRAKLLGAWQRLRGQGDDGAMLTMFVMSEDPDAALKTLTAFAEAHWPAFQHALESARGAAR